MSRIRSRDEMSSSSSQEASPLHKSRKVDEDNKEQDEAGAPSLKIIYELLLDMKNDMSYLKEGLEELKKTAEWHDKDIEALKAENVTLRSEVKDQGETVKSQSNQISALEQAIDDLEQYTRKFNLEIHGIPEKKNEDLDIIVEDLAKAIGVESFEYGDIDIVHRLESKFKPRPVIVRFQNYDDKRNIYEARRKLKYYKKDEEKLNGAERIFINENLTTIRKILYAQTRKRAKQNHWYSTWTNDGKIFVRKKKGEKAAKITKESDLEDLYS